MSAFLDDDLEAKTFLEAYVRIAAMVPRSDCQRALVSFGVGALVVWVDAGRIWLTHPSHEDRIAHFGPSSAWIEEARQEQERYQCHVCPGGRAPARPDVLTALPWWTVLRNRLGPSARP
jgi:hypothetical protein